MPTFPRFNKIFIFMLVICIFANISGCGNQSEKTDVLIDPDLIYTEIISSTMSFSQPENTTIAETTIISEITKIPETSELSEIPEITEIIETIEIIEDINTNITDLYVITQSGKKYHLQTCRTVKSIKQYLTKEEAEQLGYEPCKICKPK